jgi:hypothetical protein
VLQLYRRTGLRSKQHRADGRDISFFLGHPWTSFQWRRARESEREA